MQMTTMQFVEFSGNVAVRIEIPVASTISTYIANANSALLTLIHVHWVNLNLGLRISCERIGLLGS